MITEVNIMDAGSSGNPAGRSMISAYCDIVYSADSASVMFTD